MLKKESGISHSPDYLLDPVEASGTYLFPFPARPTQVKGSFCNPNVGVFPANATRFHN